MKLKRLMMLSQLRERVNIENWLFEGMRKGEELILNGKRRHVRHKMRRRNGVLRVIEVIERLCELIAERLCQMKLLVGMRRGEKVVQERK